jgi:hypothetical protein
MDALRPQSPRERLASRPISKSSAIGVDRNLHDGVGPAHVADVGGAFSCKGDGLVDIFW